MAGVPQLFDAAADMLVETVHFSSDLDAHRPLILAIVPNAPSEPEHLPS